MDAGTILVLQSFQARKKLEVDNCRRSLLWPSRINTQCAMAPLYFFGLRRVCFVLGRNRVLASRFTTSGSPFIAQPGHGCHRCIDWVTRLSHDLSVQVGDRPRPVGVPKDTFPYMDL